MTTPLTQTPVIPPHHNIYAVSQGTYLPGLVPPISASEFDRTIVLSITKAQQETSRTLATLSSTITTLHDKLSQQITSEISKRLGEFNAPKSADDSSHVTDRGEDELGDGNDNREMNTNPDFADNKGEEEVPGQKRLVKPANCTKFQWNNYNVRLVFLTKENTQSTCLEASSSAYPQFAWDQDIWR